MAIFWSFLENKNPLGNLENLVFIARSLFAIITGDVLEQLRCENPFGLWKMRKIFQLLLEFSGFLPDLYSYISANSSHTAHLSPLLPRRGVDGIVDGEINGQIPGKVSGHYLCFSASSLVLMPLIIKERAAVCSLLHYTLVRL